MEWGLIGIFFFGVIAFLWIAALRSQVTHLQRQNHWLMRENTQLRSLANYDPPQTSGLGCGWGLFLILFGIFATVVLAGGNLF